MSSASNTGRFDSPRTIMMCDKELLVGYLYDELTR